MTVSDLKKKFSWQNISLDPVRICAFNRKNTTHHHEVLSYGKSKLGIIGNKGAEKAYHSGKKIRSKGGLD